MVDKRPTGRGQQEGVKQQGDQGFTRSNSPQLRVGETITGNGNRDTSAMTPGEQLFARIGLQVGQEMAERQREKEDTKSRASNAAPESGTMRHVTDVETINKYINGLNSNMNTKSAFILANIPFQKNTLLIDIGCMTGKVVHNVWKSSPGLRVEGIDINSDFIKKATTEYPELRFRVGDISKGLPYRDSEVSAFSISGVLHEVYTYNDFSEQPVKTTLSEMYRALRPEGRVIVREPVMPQKPHELLRITFESTKGANPNTEKELLETIPSALSDQARMKRFLLQFKVLKLTQNRSTKEQITMHADGSYELPAWLIGEFLRKRTYTDTQEHWNAEMGEQNAPFTSDDFAKLAEETGFQKSNMTIQNVFEKNFYGEIKEGSGITIMDSNGQRVHQADRFPSHLYAVLEK